MMNSARGSRVALAAAVVAVMAMSAVSAEAAVRRMSVDGARRVEVARAKRASDAPSLLRRMASGDFMIRFWEPFGELPIVNMPRLGSQK